MIDSEVVSLANWEDEFELSSACLDKDLPMLSNNKKDFQEAHVKSTMISLRSKMQGFHIGDGGYPCYPPSNGYSGGPVASGYYLNDREIKMDPDAIMDRGFQTPSPLSGYHSPSSVYPDYDGMSGRSSANGRKNKEDKICGVCGDRALGYNFDAISCESCKAFFRRNAPKGLEYFKCPYDEKCKMDISNRRFCKRCRLKKCFEIGMRKEYILTDTEKAVKRQKIEQNRCGKKLSPTQMIRDLERNGLWKGEVATQTRPLTEEEKSMIEELKTAYMASLEITVEKEFPRSNTNNFVDLVNIAEVSVRRVIAMAKQVKYFKALHQTDQISLLKGGSIELLILRSVITFDKEKQHFLDPSDMEENSALKLDQFKKGTGLGAGLFEDHMRFVKSLAIDLKADHESLIILLMISLFSPDRPGLINKDTVNLEQEKYSYLLQSYLESIYPFPLARVLYPKLLLKLTDIRNLNEEHSQVLLKVNPEGIQPLMQEVLDVKNLPPSTQS